MQSISIGGADIKWNGPIRLVSTLVYKHKTKSTYIDTVTG